jgi:hypothetical protein
MLYSIETCVVKKKMKISTKFLWTNFRKLYITEASKQPQFV